VTIRRRRRLRGAPSPTIAVNPKGVAVTPKGAEMSEFASEETMAASDEMETPVDAESADDAPPASAADDPDDWES
jgi:hypothetical protein